MENKQTAVEFIKLKLEQYGDPQYCEITWVELDEIIEQAKQMEYEQHLDTWTDSRIEYKGDSYIGKEKSFEQYYLETYGKDTTTK